jgi:hypothetical protein
MRVELHIKHETEMKEFEYVIEGAESVPIPLPDEIIGYRDESGIDFALKVKERTFFYNDHPETTLGGSGVTYVTLLCELP